jgi:NAD(P)-dependent dehydrogenase (short-subunit alcohol dehydrogenase family)
MTASLLNRTILIVGGANGIGRATAALCIDRGASVVIADYDARQGEAAAREIGARFVQVDVANEASVAALFSQLDALDGLIQTAGVLRGPFVEIEDFTLDMFKQVFDINVAGGFLCAKHAAPLLKRSRNAVIVLISSQAAHTASSSYAYGSSKGGVSSLGITMAAKLEPFGIRVNVVAPGNIDTAMKRSVVDAEVALKGPAADQAQLQLGVPAGVAKILAWLVSSDADYVRGEIRTR